MSYVPTEAEIRTTAGRLGLADVNGNYRQRDRARIAAAVQQAKRDQADALDPATGNTAELLSRFRNELAGVGLTRPELLESLLVEAARHLLKTAGLQLKSEQIEETTP
ncbi:hypothetical protein [Nocardia wallacei]|uniref:hypothetical protein n=1 Tax=Nocardia wallacei TaxID=480035 RepID=UPI00245520E4|nr:hypothetical protein [Nocardia wallacei]